MDCAEVIPNTELDIWHANDAGSYDNTGFNLRGKTTSNNQGFYVFETIKPGWYLNGADYRPSHIHFKVHRRGYEELTSQLYFKGDQFNSSDRILQSLNLNDQKKVIVDLKKRKIGPRAGQFNITIRSF